MKFSRRELARLASLTEAELEEVWRCRRAYNQLGLAYQLGFVRLLNRFPAQVPFEVLDDLVLFTSLQLRLDPLLIEEYQTWQSTLSRHQQRIVDFLGLRRFDEDARRGLEGFVFEAAMRLEQTPSLQKHAQEFLAEEKISRVIREADPEGNGIELTLVRHISPIEWDNVVVYGEYRLDRRRIRRAR